MKNKVEFITNETGDWIITKLNGKVFCSGHKVSSNNLHCLLKELGVEVIDTEISDEEMEALS